MAGPGPVEDKVVVPDRAPGEEAGAGENPRSGGDTGMGRGPGQDGESRAAPVPTG